MSKTEHKPIKKVIV